MREPTVREPSTGRSVAPNGSPTGDVPLAWATPTTLSGCLQAATRARVRPPSLQGGRSERGRRGPLLVAAFALAAVAVVLGWALHGQVQPVAPADVAPLAASSDDPLLATSDVEVDVEGRVRRPGLVSLPSVARIADAIRAAGGALPGTDTSDLDLAQKVVDGQQLRVGEPGAVSSTAAPAGTAPPATAGAATPGAVGAG